MIDVKVQKVKVAYNEMPKGITYYFIGPPKTGKSTQASKWSKLGAKGVLVLDSDLGADFVDGANIVPLVSFSQMEKEEIKGNKRVLTIIPPEERGFVYRNGPNAGKPMAVYSMTEIWQWLKANWGKLPYDTIVIDTIDQINEWIEDDVTKELGISEMGQGDWGSDWAKARKMNADVVKKIQMLVKKTGGNLILISHSKKTMVQDDKVQLGPALPSGLGKALTAKADIIGFTSIKKATGKHIISFRSYDERSVGSRITALAQKELPFSYEEIKKEILRYKPE